MKAYTYENNLFTIYNYNQQSPFANFLPGIAGKMGIPLWVFYSNRGQAISGYGIQDKNRPIMAFTPANKAYETTPITGFRTFIKVNGEVIEPFSMDLDQPHKMSIDFASFSIEQTIKRINLFIKVTYFGLVNEPIGGLIRKVEFKNLGEEDLEVEVLDGIAEILPSGIQNAAFKSTSNLLASWADVKYLKEKTPFFTLRASTGDSSEVKKMTSGNFYYGLVDKELIEPIVDPKIIFGENTSKTRANGFINNDLVDLLDKNQITTNQFACSFIPFNKNIKANDTITLYAMTGYADEYQVLRNIVDKTIDNGYFEEKYQESQSEIKQLIDDVKTESAFPIFDAYIQQNYMDNFIRGGYPEKIGDTIYHLYSRRHGDLERDYNFFSLAPEYYSQGNGNFRDVCQNRRLDSFMNKDVKDFNIKHFASLIQLDGYNPLAINGILYEIADDVNLEKMIEEIFDNSKDKLLELFSQPFTPGTIVNFVERNKIKSPLQVQEYLARIIENSKPSIQATFGEGFWIDHFTYILDLIESYESIYPDKMSDLLFNQKEYLYYDSPVSIKKKSEKIVLNDEGNVRQYGSLIHFDDEKVKRLKMNPHGSQWIQLADKAYQSNLFEKLFILVLNKHSLLDPDGIGIEMEAEKPGWNDAMNGLPGLLGSGVSESIELLRIVEFLDENLDKKDIELPVEVIDMFNQLVEHKTYNDRVEIREKYRDNIRFGIKGEFDSLGNETIKNYLVSLKNHLIKSLQNLFEESQGIIPTFLRYEVDDYDFIKDESGNNLLYKDYRLVKPLTFKRKALAPFLEAPARLLKTSINQDKLIKMHKLIKKSNIYDKKLNMYKTSAPLDNESHEIGRIHAFTKGWLERESNFLHMTYKYLLGLIKAGLYDEFYKEIKENLVCFMDPAIYKRSTLENSSFIATSNNPDPNIHGKGFFARLSGSTVEAVNMWSIMMTGGHPFKYENGQLILEFKPKLHHAFFKDKRISFNFLKEIEITYITNDLVNTYDEFKVNKIELIGGDGLVVINDTRIQGQHALDIRNGLYKRINIYIN